MSVTWIVRIPAGETSSGRSSVTAPTKPTLTEPNSWVQVGASAWLLSDFLRTLAAMYSQFAPPYGLVLAL